MGSIEACMHNLDSETRVLVNEVAKGNSKLKDLSRKIQTATQAVQGHVTAHRLIEADEAYRNRLLESLAFPEMNVRQERIKDAHAKTFE